MIVNDKIKTKIKTKIKNSMNIINTSFNDYDIFLLINITGLIVLLYDLFFSQSSYCFLKIKSILKLEFIDQVKSKNIDQNNQDIILELIAINLFKIEEKFEITLLFKNNAFITLLTEVLEVTLEDQNKLND